MQRHSCVGELVLPIRCCQNGCKSSFTKVCSLIRHLVTYHLECTINSDVNVWSGTHDRPIMSNALQQNENIVVLLFTTLNISLIY